MAHPTDMITYDNSLKPSQSRSVIRKWADLATFGNVTPLLRLGEREVGVSHMAALMHTIGSMAKPALLAPYLARLAALAGLFVMACR